MPFVAPLPDLLRPLGSERYRTVGGPLVRVSALDGARTVVPDGYPTDLASVPRPVRWLIPREGPHEAAAIVHDLGCDQLNTYLKAVRAAVAGQPIGLRLPDRSSNRVDLDFRHDLRDLGQGVVRRWLAWVGVRWGALLNPARREGWWRTALPVLLLSILALPIAVPTLAVVGALTLLDLIEPACSPQPAAPGELIGDAVPERAA